MKARRVCGYNAFALFLSFLEFTSLFLPIRHGDADDIVLGRIEIKSEAADEYDTLGPARLRLTAATLFGELLEGRELQGLTQSRVESLLAGKQLWLLNRETHDAFPVQWEPLLVEQAGETDGNLVWLCSDASAPPVGSYSLALRPVTKSSPLTVENSSAGLLVKSGEDRILQYNVGVVQQQAGVDGPFDRACYLHPVWTPSGKIITGDFSPEHIHQRGIFTAWVKARFAGVETDFWGLGESQGRLLPSGEATEISTGPVFAKIAIKNHGVIADQVVLGERVEIIVYTGTFAGSWLFDLKTSQSPVPETGRMELPKIRYGGTSFRGPATWLLKDSREVQRAIDQGIAFPNNSWLPSDVKLDVLTSNGDGRADGDRTRIRWLDYTGPLGTNWGGVAMYDHPSNLRYPTPIRIHPELPYFSLAVVQQESLVVTADSPLELLYRIRTHDSRPMASLDERFSRSFVVPVRAVWTNE